ncbi:hypothetical protein, partial [Frankia sp. Mgl5]|uniref:hypothetical protein n=1 Tax=Frankia sp. Mgl5 TaxID=2933793 RepID=UPI00200C0F5D
DGDENDDGHQGGIAVSVSGPVTPTMVVVSSHWSATSAAQLTPPGTWPSISSHRCKAGTQARVDAGRKLN